MTDHFNQFDWLKKLAASDLDRTSKLVGVVMFNYADSDGTESRPGPALVARELQCTTRTVTRSLATLRDAGWITVTTRGGIIDGTNKANVWRLTYPSGTATTDASDTPDTGDRGDTHVPTPHVTHDMTRQDTHVPTPMSPMSYHQPNNQPNNQINNQPTAHAPTLTVVNGGFGSAVEPEKSLRKESSPNPGDIDPWSGAPIPDPRQCPDHRTAGGFGCPNCRAA